MVNPTDLTVAQLKEKLRQRDLSTAGNKAELILRLNSEDPQGIWMNEEVNGNNVRDENGEIDNIESANLNKINQNNSDAPTQNSTANEDQDGVLRELAQLRRKNASLIRTLSARQHEDNDIQDGIGREMEHIRRENALLLRELEVTQCEHRASTAASSQNSALDPRRYASIKTLGNLLSESKGAESSFDK